MTGKTYEDGLQEGELSALKEITAKHSDRLDGHSNRLRGLDRTLWVAGGFIIAVQSIPAMRAVIEFVGQIR